MSLVLRYYGYRIKRKLKFLAKYCNVDCVENAFCKLCRRCVPGVYSSVTFSMIGIEIRNLKKRINSEILLPVEYSSTLMSDSACDGCSL